MSKSCWVTLLLVALIGTCYGSANHTHGERAFNLAYFYTDINSGGYQLPISSWVNIPDLSAYNSLFYNTISSLGISDPNTGLLVCTGINYSGTCWSFAYASAGNVTQFVSSLISYGLNDNIKSMKVIPATIGGSTTNPGAIFYADNNYQGVSVAVTTGSYPVVNSNTIVGYLGAGAFPNDALSSIIIFPYTRLAIYQNSNFNTLMLDVPNPYNFILYGPTGASFGGNDLMSSFKLGPCLSSSNCPDF